MQANTALPTDYDQQATLDLSRNRKAVVGVIVAGIVLLVVVAWLLVQFSHFCRPTAIVGKGFGDIVTATADGELSVVVPFQLIVNAVIALALVMPIHELVHYVLYWRFAGRPPTFGIKGILVYAAAPSEVYFPRRQYLIVGIAPLVLDLRISRSPGNTDMSRNKGISWEGWVREEGSHIQRSDREMGSAG